ncbi:MAG: hypothetical protein JWO38_3866 [Gemmataceae bacterium]|nr:hypothetical protein [Gemmataceae bacterium]
MARVFGFLMTLVMAVGVTPRAGAEPPQTTIKLGVLSGMFRDVPPPVVQAAAAPFRDLFKKHTSLDGDIEVVDEYEVLAARLNEKKLQFGVFHGFEWAWVRGRYPDLQALVVTVPPKKPQACIVVHVESNATKPAHLKGACVAVPSGTKIHSELYHTHLLGTLPAGCCRPVNKATWGPEEALDAVGNGDVAAALVDTAALSAYQNNKPGAATQVKVLCQSDPFPPAVIVYRKGGVDEVTVEKIRGGLLKVKDNPQGRAFLFLWKLKGFEDVPAGYDAELHQTLKAYPPPARPEKAPSPK